jgi:hypothetical protein
VSVARYREMGRQHSRLDAAQSTRAVYFVAVEIRMRDPRLHPERLKWHYPTRAQDHLLRPP